MCRIKVLKRSSSQHVRRDYDGIEDVENITLLFPLVLKVFIRESENTINEILPQGTLVTSYSSDRPKTPSYVNGHLPERSNSFSNETLDKSTYIYNFQQIYFV